MTVFARPQSPVGRALGRLGSSDFRSPLRALAFSSLCPAELPDREVSPWMFYLKTLGALWLSRNPSSADGDKLSGSKSLVIVALLATSPGYRERRDHLAELLWPGSERSRRLRTLRQSLFYLSQNGEVVEREEDVLALATDRVAVDLWEFDAALKGDDYGRAIQLYEGRFLEGFEGKGGTDLEHRIEAENSRIFAGLEVAYNKEIARARQTGNADEAIRLSRDWVRLNPLDHDGQWNLLRALLAVGDHIGALRSYEAYRTLVSRELEEEPPPELTRTMQLMRDELLSVAPTLVNDHLTASSQEAHQANGDRRRPWWGPLRRVDRVAGVVVITLLLLFLGFRFSVPPRPPTAGPLLEVQGRLLVTVERGSQPEAAIVEIRGSAVDVQSSQPFGRDRLPAPDGNRIAFSERSADGWNLAVRDESSGEVRTLTQNESDEFPLAWSPDGQMLLFGKSRLLADGRRHTSNLAIFDLTAGTETVVSATGTSARPSASWSPNGVRLAYTADVNGAAEVFVSDADGANIRNVSRHRLMDREPSWSPGLQRIAFVSNRGGDIDLYTVRPDGSDLRQITTTVAEETTPAWLSQTILAFVALRGDEGDLWLVDTFTGETRQITTSREVTGVVAVLDQPRRWIEQVTINPRNGVVSPGQWVDLGTDAVFAAALSTGDDMLPVRWSVAPDSVAEIEDNGRLHVVGIGQAKVIASAGGWRADTLRISSVEISPLPLEPVFREDWLNGLQEDRWLSFGHQGPRTEPTGAPSDGGMLLNSGGATFEGGVVTLAAFSPDRGLTVEVDGRLRFTGKLHQVFGIALYEDEPDDSLLAAGEAVPVVEFMVEGPVGTEGGRAWIATPDNRHSLPFPDNARFWREYVLQILPDGSVELIVDGSVYWRSPYQLRPGSMEPLHLALGFQSFETQIAHGIVRVYEGAKYRTPEMEEPDDAEGLAVSP